MTARVNPEKLKPETQRALMELKRCLASEGFIIHAQVTFDQVAAADVPPTVDFVGFHKGGVV